MVLVELGVVEERFLAVLEVLGGESVTDVARCHGVVRQTVHRWLRRYVPPVTALLASFQMTGRVALPDTERAKIWSPIDTRVSRCSFEGEAVRFWMARRRA